MTITKERIKSLLRELSLMTDEVITHDRIASYLAVRLSEDLNKPNDKLKSICQDLQKMQSYHDR